MALTIAIDFDGTLVKHEYPKIGKELPGAFNVLRRLQKGGHKLILLTMRSGKELEEAVNFCAEKGIKFWAVNDNPTQSSWTSSRKVYANMYIDDAALGVPRNEDGVEWRSVEVLLFGR